MCKLNFHDLDSCALLKIFCFTLLVRALLSGMKTMESHSKYFLFNRPIDRWNAPSDLEIRKQKFSEMSNCRRFLVILCGFSSKEPFPDYWYNTAIGFIELCVFPLLMVTHQYPFIGGWIVLKTAAQWDAWKANRNAINRFVIATALQLIFSYVCLANWPSLKN